MCTILIINNDREITTRLSDILYRHGFNVITAENAAEGISKFIVNKPKLVLLDLVLPDMSGLEALDDIKRISPETSVIIISTFASVDNAVEAMKLGASDFRVKPFNIEEFVIILKRTLEEARLEHKTEIKLSETTIKAFSNPIRKNITFYLLHAGVSRFSDIAGSIGISDASKLSYHLRILSEAGIVDKTKAGQYLLPSKGAAMVKKLLLLSYQ